MVRACMFKKQFFSSVYRLPLSACDGTELSPLGCLSPVCGMDKEQMHSGDKCLEVPSPLIPKQAGARIVYAFNGNRMWTTTKRVATGCHFFRLCWHASCLLQFYLENDWERHGYLGKTAAGEHLESSLVFAMTFYDASGEFTGICHDFLWCINQTSGSLRLCSKAFVF